MLEGGKKEFKFGCGDGRRNVMGAVRGKGAKCWAGLERRA